MTVLARLRRRSDLLVLEACPLHTERPEWATHAPGQVEAACRRGADVIGLTETRGPTMPETQRRAEDAGYHWYSHPVDRHRNVTLLVKGGLHVIHHGAVLVANNWRPQVTFDFHGRPATVYGMHWEPAHGPKAEQTASLIEAMTATSRWAGLSFYLGDGNPSKPQPTPGSEPGATLDRAGMPVIYRELHHYPPGIGVTMVGRNSADRAVTAVRVMTHDPLGSDHVPATATYRVRRRLSGSTRP